MLVAGAPPHDLRAVSHPDDRARGDGRLCTAADVPRVRFANTPAVTVVDDRRDVAAKPSEREFVHSLYHYDGVLHGRVARALELPRA
jgi:hypothetical protein